MEAIAVPAGLNAEGCHRPLLADPERFVRGLLREDPA